MRKPRLFPRIVGKYLTLRRIAVLLFLAVGLMTITGFKMSPQESDLHGGREESSAAIERFWQVYHGNQFIQIPEVQQQLQNAIERDPNNSTLYALLGATHF
jgi:hypothetical protein